MTDATVRISDEDIVRIVKGYYAAVDSMDADRLAST